MMTILTGIVVIAGFIKLIFEIFYYGKKRTTQKNIDVPKRKARIAGVVSVFI